MAGLLTDLLAAGLIERLDGEDSRFEKMEKAVDAVARKLRDDPATLIRAILAGLDPDVAANDPAIMLAERALTEEWKSMSSVHPSTPVRLLRAILFASCQQAAEGTNAAILWLTAADTFPLMRLGKEEAIVRQLLENWAKRAEEAALSATTLPAAEAPKGPTVPKLAEFAMPAAGTIDRAGLLKQVQTIPGPSNQQGTVPNANPTWPQNDPNAWATHFADRMHKVLADQLDSLLAHAAKSDAEMAKHFEAAQSEVVKAVGKLLTAQQRWLQDDGDRRARRTQLEQLRLNALWWSEALFSPSLRRSYRDLSPALAVVVMAVDLLSEASRPTPASVAFLLAEAVNRIPGAGFALKKSLPELLKLLRDSRGDLPKEWLKALAPPPDEGRLSLRDLIWFALSDREVDLDRVAQRAGLLANVELSLPGLAQALFRQEQALLLARSVE